MGRKGNEREGKGKKGNEKESSLMNDVFYRGALNGSKIESESSGD
jgi:hypothetical protein